MYDDLLCNKKEHIDSIDLNELLEDKKFIKKIERTKYNYDDVWGIFIDDDKIEKDVLIDIKNKILKNTDIEENEIVFIIKNIRFRV